MQSLWTLFVSFIGQMAVLDWFYYVMAAAFTYGVVGLVKQLIGGF